MNKLNLKEIKERAQRATSVSWIVSYTDKDTVSDWSILGCREEFKTETEARECAKRHVFKGKPDYWQPNIEKHIRNDVPDNARTDIPLLIEAFEKLSANIGEIKKITVETSADKIDQLQKIWELCLKLEKDPGLK